MVCDLTLTQLDKIGKTTNIFEMEDVLNSLKMEYDLNLFENGRRPQVFEMEEDLNFFENGIGHHFFF